MICNIRNKTGYDLNSLLKIANIIICAIGIYLYYKLGSNQYVNEYTIIILCIFCIQNLLILSYEKKRTDPFVLILMIIAVIFYMGRVVTLLYDPWSSILTRYPFTSYDLNYSLIFIMLSNASIVLGLSTGGGKNLNKQNVLTDAYPANPRNVMLILVATIVIGFYIRLSSDIIGRFAGYITGVFIQLHLILLFTFIYVAVNFRKTSNRNLVTLLILTVTFIIFATLSGSRSGLLTVGYLLLIGFLSVKGRIKINKKLILISPLVILLSFFIFDAATYIRKVDTKRIIGSKKQLTTLKNYSIGSKDVKILCRSIFDRGGFLDNPADMIRNKEQYHNVINIIYYFKSAIDNGLTPGFNIFDTPKAANALRYIYGYTIYSSPIHKDIKAAYHSSMLTIYGEYYVLFGGYSALIIFFIFSHIFKKLYLSVKSKDAFLFYLYRALILYVFWLWINSFGMDWMVLDLISIFITVGLFKNFYKMRRRKEPIYKIREVVAKPSY